MANQNGNSVLAAKRSHRIGIAIFMLFSLLFARLWFLQVNARENFIKNAKFKRERVIVAEAPRGRVLDRNGKVLIDNKYVPSISLQKTIGATNALEICKEIAPILGIPSTLLFERWASDANDPIKPVVIARGVSFEALTFISERQSEYAGIEVIQVPVRVYKYGDVGAHLLGYTGLVSQDDIDENDAYRLGDYVGKSGVEKTYEGYLRGKPSIEKVEVDNKGRVVKTLSKTKSTPGNDVFLTVDIETQVAAEKQISRGTVRTKEREISDQLLTDGTSPSKSKSTKVEKEKIFTSTSKPGASVLIEPDTGEIITMASYPTFNPTAFLRGTVSQDEFDEANLPKNNFPLNNRTIQGQYPPGSTFKLVSAIAALNSGLLTKDKVILDGGKIIIGNQEFTNAGSTAYGPVALTKSLAVSSDIYYYLIGREFWQIWNKNNNDPKGLALQETAKGFGLGKLTGLDNDVEQPGRIPSPESKKAIAEAIGSSDTQWLPGNNVQFAIGQGDTLVTPLQLARIYATFANGGDLLTPTNLKRIETHDGKLIKKSKVVKVGHVPLKKENRDAIIEGLRGAVTGGDGTANTAFAGSPIIGNVYGKTGTSEVTGKADHALFAGVYSKDGYKVAGMVLMENSGFGGEVAAPMLRRIFEKYDEQLATMSDEDNK